MQGRFWLFFNINCMEMHHLKLNPEEETSYRRIISLHLTDHWQLGAFHKLGAQCTSYF